MYNSSRINRLTYDCSWLTYKSSYHTYNSSYKSAKQPGPPSTHPRLCEVVRTPAPTTSLFFDWRRLI